MRKISLLALLVFTLSTGNAQYTIYWSNKEYPVTKTSIIKDSSGKSYNYSECLIALTGGKFELRPPATTTIKCDFLLTPLTKEEQLQRVTTAPKPKESSAFKTGKKMPSFRGTDINGNIVDLDDLKGKILVLNFWFINCFPCRLERPYLNEIVNEYKSDKDIVFIAVGLEPKSLVDSFLKENPIDYVVIPDGREIAKTCNISAYPTHVIINKQGKVAFHTVSYNAVTGYWMRKTIDELKKSSE